MSCNCSLEQNYKVIGLCDVKKINDGKKIEPKKAWVQITIPEILTIPECKPTIEEIDKIYISAKVNSVRIIKTPKSPKNDKGEFIPSKEGTILTGRKLLVDGSLCQTIVYTANNRAQTVHAANFEIPFCVHIVIDEDANIELDKYCVDICIEDVFATVVDKKNIFKNVTLFLQAKKEKNPHC